MDPVTSVCTCGAVVGDAAAHAAWHASLALAAPGMAAPVTTHHPGTCEPTPVAAAPSAQAVERLRARADAALAAINSDALPALDAYLAISSPTQAQALTQVRTLTTIVRALSVAARALIRLVIHRLDSTD